MNLRFVFSPITLIAVAIVGFVLLQSVFTVHQTQQALVLRLGQPVNVISTPGLKFKVPFLDTVTTYDKRILDLDTPAQEVIALDQKRLVVDAFARYKIKDALRFYQTVGSVAGANNRLNTVVNSSTRRVLGENTFATVVRDDRDGLMGKIRDQVNREAANFGITVVDVRLRRADLPEANSQAIYSRMQTERQREASELRAQGAEFAQRIRATSDKDGAIILAEANKKSEQIRGLGDAERNKIFASAFGKDKEFFAFYRSMQAYENALSRGDTKLILSPNSDFFSYFGAKGVAKE